MKKSVLMDICDIANPTCGFGQIAQNYARIYPQIDDEELDFTLMMPAGYGKELGDKVHVYNLPAKGGKVDYPVVDLWHQTTQFQLKRKRGKSAKYIFTIHDLNYVTEKGWLSRKKHDFRIKRALKKADLVTCISHYVANQVKKRFRLDDNRVRVIYNGVEDITGVTPQKPVFVTGRKFLFTIGQIRKKKNFHVLVDMMKYLPDYDLYICGDDHFKYSKEVREHIAALPSQNAFLCGKITQEEKVWLYANCDAFVFASMGEGFGLPVIEAMQFGRAVYSSGYTCLPEICGDSAFIWENLEPEAMAAALKSTLLGFYDDEERIRSIKAHAQGFSYEKHVNTYIELYKEVLVNE